jgi:hypothetical protein
MGFVSDGVCLLGLGGWDYGPLVRLAGLWRFGEGFADGLAGLVVRSFQQLEVQFLLE